jgi:hypothetical protein
VSEPAPVDDDFETAYGLPRPLWARIRPRVFAETEPAKCHALWCAAQREWLQRLRGALAQPYQVSESEHFMVLTAARGDVAWLNEYAEQARREVDDLLTEPSGSPRATVGKLAVLIFAGEAEYHRYLRHFSADGRPPVSAGAWINNGDSHIAIAGITGFKPVLVHELVHARLANPRRPLWLEEGLAQVMERRLVVRQRTMRSMMPVTRLRQELRPYWLSHTLDGFWSGEAFKDKRPMGARPYAYELADQIVSDLASLSEADLRRFAAAARRDDAGAAASREIYGIGLEVWARNVLGEGDWAPRPAKAADPPPVDPPVSPG